MTPDDRSIDTANLALRRDDEAAPRRRGLGGRATLLAGVAGACVLGAGLGLWARPAANERHVAMAPPQQEAPPPPPGGRTLQIVVNDGPAAPLGAPIEVLPKPSRPMFTTLRPAQTSGGLASTPELTRIEPKPWPKLETPHLALPDMTPLVTAALAAPEHWLQKAKAEAASREVAEAAAKQAAAARTRAEAQAQADAKLAADRAARQAVLAQQRVAQQHLATREAAEARAAAHRVELARAAQAKAAAKAEQVRLAEARAARTQEAKLEAARLAEAKAKKAQLQQAKLEQAKLAEARAARAEKLRLAKAEKAEALKLAQAEAKGRAEARAEARALVLAEAREEAKKRERLEALVHAVQKVLPRAQAQPTHVARLDRKHALAHRREPEVERASLKTRKAASRGVEPPARSRPAPVVPANPSGLMRVSTPRCASHDPGAALVCADPGLSAADRQLTRAYQDARAAGVPDGHLQAQQQRWLAARSAAAREAPWAVRDVYLARIAELNSQAREAHGEN